MGDAAPEEVAAPAEAPSDVSAPAPTSASKDANRSRYFVHWKRPTHLQYKYISDFRQNYYSDLIDYLDSRSRGIRQDAPKPQYWAERALRHSRDRTRLESSSLLSASTKLDLLANSSSSSTSSSHTSTTYTIRRGNVTRRVTSFIL